MPAITKAWTDIADTAVDPDSPLTTGLLTAFRDQGIHLREWLGAGFFAGAVQDHNHDGQNSARIQVGPNFLRNGSFEDGLAAWTFTDFTGGSHAIDTANHRHGAQSIAITSTVLANGGGEAVSNEYIGVSESDILGFKFWIAASLANVSSKMEVVWYDSAKSQISAATLQSYANTPTTLTLHRAGSAAPTNARWLRLRLTGGVPGSGSSTGTVYFDGIEVGYTPISQATILAGAVGQAQLKTTTSAGSTSSATTPTQVTYSLAGGSYSWWTAGASLGGTGTCSWGGGNIGAGVLGIFLNADGTNSTQFHVDERYVQASPPYNLGDGSVPLFVWGLVDSGGRVVGTQIAPDPPWAYHGPTNITPEFSRGERLYRRYPKLEGRLLDAALKDRAALRRYMAGQASIELEEMEIDDAIKNRDMALFPHPFVGTVLTGKTVVLIDPVSIFVERLRAIHEAEGAGAVREFLTEGWLNIDNTPLRRAAPPGVIAVSAQLK